MRFRRRLPDESKPDSLNMTPMIDIVFQLLIFFMLSMHFKEVEGKLLSQLPKHKGPESAPATPDLRELRVVLCAGGDLETHLTDKGRHEKAGKRADPCSLSVEKVLIGEVRRTESSPGEGIRNRSTYRALGAKAKELYAGIPVLPGKPPAPVIIDADREVPYEHVIGALNALKEAGLETIEFVANPHFPANHGSPEEGPFPRAPRR